MLCGITLVCFLFILSTTYCVHGVTECKPTARGIDYRGSVSETVNGIPCQHWISQQPHSHTFSFIDGASAHSNNCRNPDPINKPGGPWCLTTDPSTEWEYCDIQLCQNQQPVASWIFDEEHKGTDVSFLGENPVSMTDINFGTGLHGQPNGAAITPSSRSQDMTVRNPTPALRFSTSMSFVTYVYLTGNVGPILEYNDGTWKLHFWVYPDNNTLTVVVIGEPHLRANIPKAQNWYKLGFAVTREEVNIYVNDSVIHHNRQSNPLYPSTETGHVYFGKRAGPIDDKVYNNFLEGWMACAQMFDVALSVPKLRSIKCSNVACAEMVNDKCTGNCIGFNVGEKCEVFLLPLEIPRELISTANIAIQQVQIAWQLTNLLKEGTKNFYCFIVQHRKENVVDYQQSIPIPVTTSPNQTYTHTIMYLERDTIYDISIRTVRTVRDIMDYRESKLIQVKTGCSPPDMISGLYLYIYNDTFVASWESNLVKLDSGCSSKEVFLYYKYNIEHTWMKVIIDHEWTNYKIIGYEGRQCFVKMTVTNNEGQESSTNIAKTTNSHQPYVTGAWPSFGPEAGGTVITVLGNHIPVSRAVVIRLVSKHCKTIEQNVSTVLGLTPKLHDDEKDLLGRSLSVILTLGGEDDIVTSQTFTYKGNPVVSGVYPKESITKGGMLLTVTGENLDSIAVLYMTTTVVYKKLIQQNPMVYEETISTYITECSLTNITQMTCPTPELYEISKLRDKTRKKQKRHVGQGGYLQMAGMAYGKLVYSRRKRESVNVQISEDGDILEIYIGFKLDGVPGFDNVSTIEVYDTEPEFYSMDPDQMFMYKTGEPLSFQGADLDKGVSEHDYNITIGNDVCRYLKLLSNSVSCYPPKTIPQKEIDNDSGPSRIVIHIGLHIEHNAGYLEYPQGKKLHLHIIVLSIVTPAVVIVIVVLAVVCARRNKRK